MKIEIDTGELSVFTAAVAHLLRSTIATDATFMEPPRLAKLDSVPRFWLWRHPSNPRDPRLNREEIYTTDFADCTDGEIQIPYSDCRTSRWSRTAASHPVSE